MSTDPPEAMSQAAGIPPETYRTLFRRSPDGVLLVAVNGLIIEANAAACEMLGMTEDELRALRPEDLFIAGPAYAEHAAEREHTGRTAGETTFVRKDGTRFPVDFASVRPSSGSGQDYGLVSFRDITARKTMEAHLDESEARQREVLEHGGVGVAYWDLDGRLLLLNQKATENLGGTSPSDFVGKLFHELFGDEAGAAYLDRIQAAAASPTPITYEDCVDLPIGRRWLSSVHTRSLDAAGNVLGVHVYASDVTALKEAEGSYRTLFREMLDGFALHQIVCDDAGTPVDYRFMAVNPAFERMTGLKADDIVGRRVLEALPGTERYWIETYGDVALTGRPAFFENYHSQLDKHFHVTAFQPTPGQFACIFSDITERIRTEEALRESEAKMRGILENIRVGVAVISPHMEILELNPLMREWFPQVDLEQAPICYRAFNQPPRETVCEYCPTIETLRDGRVHEATLETPATGAMRSYRIVSSPISDSSGQVSAAIEMVEDVTEKLALEHQLQQSQKMESIGRLAGGVAHDFNNMLGVILGHLEMALEQIEAHQPLRANLVEVQKAAERSAELTHQLLAFARKQTVSPRVIDVNETIAGMLKMLERLIGEDIRLHWEPAADLWHVRIDPSQVGQVLANLCVNARDAIGGVGRVTIATSNRTLGPSTQPAPALMASGEYVELAVSDDGCGMDEKTMSSLFEPFFTTKGVGKGTGLGLATVYGIVKQNGGFVEVESRLGQGSKFTIYLPRHAETTEALESGTETAPPARGRETILLVEDEPALLNLATGMLQSQGYAVVAAGSPGEAMRLARDHRGEIDLLITDVVMPEMNGRDLARNLLSLYPGMKRLFMSGYTSDVIAHQGVLDEGVHFLQKPFLSKDLATRVRAVLDGEE
jgi:two-component system, cell cycle sensor histidine kinase and response regulator CckA